MSKRDEGDSLEIPVLSVCPYLISFVYGLSISAVLLVAAQGTALAYITANECQDSAANLKGFAAPSPQTLAASLGAALSGLTFLACGS